MIFSIAQGNEVLAIGYDFTGLLALSKQH